MIITIICWVTFAGILLLYGYSIYKNSIKAIIPAIIISVIALLATTSGVFFITTALGLIVLIVMAACRLIELTDKHATEK
jgi:TRAP-type C4-dicarboxylate transport system permease small subunit